MPLEFGGKPQSLGRPDDARRLRHSSRAPTPASSSATSRSTCARPVEGVRPLQLVHVRRSEQPGDRSLGVGRRPLPRGAEPVDRSSSAVLRRQLRLPGKLPDRRCGRRLPLGDAAGCYRTSDRDLALGRPRGAAQHRLAQGRSESSRSSAPMDASATSARRPTTSSTPPVARRGSRRLGSMTRRRSASTPRRSSGR